MKTRSSKSRARQAASRIKPARGAAESGAIFNPADRGEDSANQTTRSAPAPGIPISAEEYERLKRDAATARTPPSKHSQEDPAVKK